MHFYRISNNQITASKHCYSLQASYVVGINVCDKILDKCSFQRIGGLGLFFGLGLIKGGPYLIVLWLGQSLVLGFFTEGVP